MINSIHPHAMIKNRLYKVTKTDPFKIGLDSSLYIQIDYEQIRWGSKNGRIKNKR